MCKSLNISDNDLHSCIFDVAITNDTTFTDQETFKRGKVLWIQCFALTYVPWTYKGQPTNDHFYVVSIAQLESVAPVTQKSRVQIPVKAWKCIMLVLCLHSHLSSCLYLIPTVVHLLPWNSYTVELRFNEVAGDRPNLFVKCFRYNEFDGKRPKCSLYRGHS